MWISRIYQISKSELYQPFKTSLVLFSVCLALIALSSLTDAGPLPENRIEPEPRAPPKEVQVINKWLGEKKTSSILKDILEVAAAIKNIRKNKKNIASNGII